MTSVTIIPGLPVLRRAMFVLELIDPITGASAGAAFAAKAEGLRAPSLTRAGQFVWLDVDPPAKREVKVSAWAPDKQFAPYDDVLSIDKREPNLPVQVEKHVLQPTGIYRPPAGRLAAAGMLIGDRNARKMIVGAKVVLVLTESEAGGELRSSFTAVTDERGGFVGVAAGFGSEVPKPAPRPAPDGSVVGRLEVTWQNTTKTAPVTLRLAELNYLPEPLIWADLP